MADINRVILVGRLTRDCELRYSPSGLQINKFSIACNRRRKQGEEWVDEVSYFDCTLFGKFAESLERYLVKGKQIGIDGELRQNRWEQNGQTRSKVEVIVSNLQLLGNSMPTRNENASEQYPSHDPARSSNTQSADASSTPASASPTSSAPADTPDTAGDSSSFDDDIPF